MTGHIVLINTPVHNRTRFMERLIGELDASRPSTHQYQDFLVASERLQYLLGTEGYPEGLPKSLEERT